MATTSEIRALVEPFVNAKLSHERRTPAIDIRFPGVRAYDASVRGVSDEGVEYAFYRGSEVIAWADISEITLADLDANGNRIAERTVRHDASLARAA